MVTKQHREDNALTILLDYLAAKGRGRWEVESRPDETDRSKPQPDFVVRETTTRQCAVVEVTSFSWPRDAATVRASISRACREVSLGVGDAVEGIFGLSLDLTGTMYAGVFTARQRAATVQMLAELIRTNGPMMRVAEERGYTEPFRFSLARYSYRGRFQLGVISSTGIEFFTEIDELEAVLQDNARKFDGTDGVRRWLVVTVLKTEESLALMARTLRIPPQIDELFFITYDDSTPVVLEHSVIAVPDGNIIVDRQRRAVLARIPSRRD